MTSAEEMTRVAPTARESASDALKLLEEPVAKALRLLLCLCPTSDSEKGEQGAEVFARVEPATRSEMVQLRHTATTAGNRSALLYGAVFLVIALLVSTKLPLRPNEESQ